MDSHRGTLNTQCMEANGVYLSFVAEKGFLLRLTSPDDTHRLYSMIRGDDSPTNVNSGRLSLPGSSTIPDVGSTANMNGEVDCRDAPNGGLDRENQRGDLRQVCQSVGVRDRYQLGLG